MKGSIMGENVEREGGWMMEMNGKWVLKNIISRVELCYSLDNWLINCTCN